MINTIYEETISLIQQGIRPKRRLTPDEVSEILKEFENSEKSDKTIRELLCILNHTREGYLPFAPILISLLETQSDELLIFSLSASWVHIVEENFKNGNRLPLEYVEAIKELLKTRDLEVLEWTLRTVEQFGPSSIMVKKELESIKFPLTKLFSPRKIACMEIISGLVSRWPSHVK